MNKNNVINENEIETEEYKPTDRIKHDVGDIVAKTLERKRDEAEDQRRAPIRLYDLAVQHVNACLLAHGSINRHRFQYKCNIEDVIDGDAVWEKAKPTKEDMWNFIKDKRYQLFWIHADSTDEERATRLDLLKKMFQSF